MPTISGDARELFFKGKDDDPIHIPEDFNLLELPLEGMAAYWLSIAKVLSSKKSAQFVEKELDHIKEPFINHLLEIGFTSFSSEQIRRFAGIKKETLLSDLRRKLFLKLITLMGIYNRENPQQILIRIISRFPISPVLEREVFDQARELLNRAGRGSSHEMSTMTLHHNMEPQAFIVHLIFFAMLARRKGWEACAPYIPIVRSPLFSEGLSLIIDGFDYDFIKFRLNLQKNEILSDSEMKMNMATEMCIGIKEGMVYEDLFRIARSFML